MRRESSGMVAVVGEFGDGLLAGLRNRRTFRWPRSR